MTCGKTDENNDVCGATYTCDACRAVDAREARIKELEAHAAELGKSLIAMSESLDFEFARAEALAKWYAHQKNVPCAGCKDGHDTFWKSVVESPQWVAWKKSNPPWDVDECSECGHISQEHFQAFLRHVLAEEISAYKDQNERIAEMRIQDCERAEAAEAHADSLGKSLILMSESRDFEFARAEAARKIVDAVKNQRSHPICNPDPTFPPPCDLCQALWDFESIILKNKEKP